MKNPEKIITPFIISFLLIISIIRCSKDETIVAPVAVNEFSKINNFIEEKMSVYYFWNEEMPDIDPENEDDPEVYFNKLLKNPDDRWSFITDDYQELVNYFSGIRKSTGYSLLPMYLEDGNNQVVAFIEYVHKNTPSKKAGLKRGDMIYKIDGQEMTDQNFSNLLSQESFDITLAEFQGNDVIETSPEIPITAIEVTQHPIIATALIDTLGYKIGYLAYSSFVDAYNEDLENVFEAFSNAGVTDLILDLRYNGGGSVNSATLLGNMLVPPGNKGNTFIESVYNKILTNEIKKDPKLHEDFFKITFKENSNNLNLNKLHVLTTASTASASEMIIYGLEPYMDVIQIGTATYGKYYASTTFSDEQKHNWAIQPIIYRSINATDDINYSKGLPADHELADYFYLFPDFQLGDPDEFLTAKAISVITETPFLYQEFVDNIDKLKSAGRFTTESHRLKETLYPNRNEMWLNPSDGFNHIEP
jgi:carboxyl-terminal processing protease